MKQILLSLLLAVITATAFAQVGTITVTVVSVPYTGLTTIDYEFTGLAGRTYTFTTVEVDFDDGDGYQTIPEGDLSGDYPDVSGTGPDFSGTIVWDGAVNFPNRYHAHTKIRVKAQHFISGDGVTDIDGNFYPTVIIGDQEWMAKNLRVTKYNNDVAIPTGLSNTEWGNTTEGAYAIFDHDHSDATGINTPEEMVEAYGKLYNWHAVAVADARGLCPAGWRVPSHDDWTQLEQYMCNALGNSDCGTHFPYDNTTSFWKGTNEGNALKSCRQVGSPLEGCNTSEHPRWNSHSTHYGFDEFGFSALPGGYRHTDGDYFLIGDNGYWWSSSEYSSASAWYRNMVSSLGNVFRYNNFERNGFSVRCIKDD